MGAGPGGYVAAIKAAHLGLKVAIVEKSPMMGGTCLLRGCIPTKTLLAHAAVYKQVKIAEHFGIHIENVSFNYKTMKEKKDSVVKELSSGIGTLLGAAKVEIFEGVGSFDDAHTIKIKGRETKKVTTKHTIIATGSVPSELPFAPVDKKVIHDSTSILEIEEVPKHLIVFGGGYIGCEFASLFHELGAKKLRSSRCLINLYLHKGKRLPMPSPQNSKIKELLLNLEKESKASRKMKEK